MPSMDSAKNRKRREYFFLIAPRRDVRDQHYARRCDTCLADPANRYGLQNAIDGARSTVDAIIWCRKTRHGSIPEGGVGVIGSHWRRMVRVWTFLGRKTAIPVQE